MITTAKRTSPLIALIFSATQACCMAESTPAPTASTTPPVAPADEKNKDSTVLVAQFKTTMTDATLAGRWSLIHDGKLGPEKADQYTVLGVNHLLGEMWLIRASFQYGGQEITLPIPLRVKWAGDTPIIAVDNVGIPGGETYSARVMIYGNTYAGTWSGGKIAGVMSGVIRNAKAPAAPGK